MSVTVNRDAIGPVDVVVIGFVGDAFNGEVAPALFDLVESGTIRIIDLAFVRKAADGTTDAIEIEDSEVAALFAELDEDHHDLLNDVDLAAIADDLEPATAALVVVFENCWAARFATAVRASQGMLLSFDRIPHDIVVAAIDALEGE